MPLSTVVMDPCAVLGAQRVFVDDAVTDSARIRVLWPGNSTPAKIEVIGVDVLGASVPVRVLAVLGLAACGGETGLFEGVIAQCDWPLAYRLRITDQQGHQQIVEDAYRFGSMLDSQDRDYRQDLQRFAAGEHDAAQQFMGAHSIRMPVAAGSAVSVSGVRFCVWAPNARRVSVVGDFNNWNEFRHLMRHHPEYGVWELFVPGVAADAAYKYSVLGAHGALTDAGQHKADPYAFVAERPPATASRVTSPGQFGRDNRAALAARLDANERQAPVAIYEVHPGSWRRGEANNYLNWDELADTLVPYAQQLNFTHLQLMPIAEYPFAGSWGYQPISLFAPSSRFGDAEGFRRFVERAHRSGLGVLLDWVPAHFPADAHGLENFDGTALYEHADAKRRMHPDWGTLIYNYSRNEVKSFLFSAAQYWIDHYGVDGLRVDAVASMLYLDYSRKDGEWQPNAHGGREDLAAVEFVKELNTRVYRDRPGAMMVAEESTAWDGVTRPVEHGGLGFGYKWNMGWMNDTLAYFQQDPVHRSHHHNQLTFSMVYAFDENFVLPLSHDEVVHGKQSLLERMPGDRWQQFANLRLCYGYMWGHPGKKLLFMGGEFGQQQEWNHNQSLDWHLLAGHDHRGVQQLIGDLNALYRRERALHEGDCVAGQFQWLDVDNAQDSVIAFARTSLSAPDQATDETNSETVVVVCNFTPVVRKAYRIGVPLAGHYAELLNTDSQRYGGSNVGNAGGVAATVDACNGFAWSIVVDVPPLACVYFKVQR